MVYNPTQYENNNKKILFATALIFGFLLLNFVSDSSLATEIEGLKGPILNLKKQIFGGWMVAIKVCAAAAGIVFSVFKGSLAPFGIGAGLTLGIHLYDEYLTSIVTGALI